MKLRNKKTGEIVDYNPTLERWNGPSKETKHYVSLAELNDEWEDYEELKAYYIGRCGTIEEFDPTKDVALTEMLKEIGNYFETKEEAEKAAKKLQAWTRLNNKGFRITLRGCKGNAWLEANWGNLQGDYSDVLFLFGGEE